MSRPPHKTRGLSRVLPLLLALALSPVVPSACGSDSTEAPRGLILRITSDATRGNQTLGRLRILMSKGESFYPPDLDDPRFNPLLGTLDPRVAPVLLSVAYEGATFGDGKDVKLEVVGRSNAGDTFLVRGEATVDLDFVGYVDVHLLALPDGCDEDGDGFLDCSTSGCCAADSEFGDCDPEDADINPWGTEDACEPCADTVDQDCRGGDTACVDTDADGIEDCAEIACGANDGTVGPGLPEICDGKDNDCNDATDEGLTLRVDGVLLALGDACGKGACQGGTVECAEDGSVQCSTDELAAAEETCYDDIDNNCDGFVDEGCPPLDQDDDTFTVDQGDCDDNDDTVYPGADELCDGKDNDCNEATDEGFPDLDDDLVADCVDPDIDGDDVDNDDDNCPTVANGDQADVDSDGLGDACDPCVDADGDGWGRGGTNPAECARGAAPDCDDAPGNTSDGDADNVCGDDDNCPDVANADQLNTDGDAFGDACDACIDVDGDGWGRGGIAMAQCPSGFDMDCNDEADNTADADGDNACTPNDNCPGLANPLQTDVDDDGVGDACDPCVDADGDGRGRAGTDTTGCSEAGVTDCNDVEGNTDDVDDDNICLPADNCPETASSDLTDTDGDGVGDVCDLCTDMDGDGWGSAGLDLNTCTNGPAVDCDDAVGNTSDPDADNVCNPDDICPTDFDPDQLDADGDDIGDACDPCVDVDGDGWGRSGTNMALCTRGAAVDCDDTDGNTSDEDVDNVCGDDDNCADVANADQADVDADGLGDACDACTDKDGDGWGVGGLDPAQCPRGDAMDCNDEVDNAADPDADNVCNPDDNCPSVANADQTNTDEDNFGDACDVCIDVDGDGWGRGGTEMAQCPQGDAMDCNDTADNTADDDFDNVCAPEDNCPDVANANQTNTDGDAFGDACDVCIDVDEDGWGRSGTDMAQCPNGAVEDCDDTDGNVADVDEDNVCLPDDNCPNVSNPDQADADDDGTGDACEFVCPGDVDADGICDGGRGVTCDETNVAECDDNCVGVANPLQHDSDRDGFGDACDEPFEVCTDCLDNDRDGVTDLTASDEIGAEAAACAYRRVMAVGARNVDVPVGHPVGFTFDHAFLVAAGRSRSDGEDVRIFYVDPTTFVWTELDRVIDPAPGWNRPSTTLWFAAQQPIDAMTADVNYRLVHGGAVEPGMSPPSDPAGVFRVWDDFERADSAALGEGWVELESDGNTAALVSGGVEFDTADGPVRPTLSLPFDAITSGQHMWHIGWNWVNTGEGNYSVIMQLGDSQDATWDATPDTVNELYGGSGPFFAWAGNQFGRPSGANTFVGVDDDGAVHVIGSANTRLDFELFVDMDTQTFQVFPSTVPGQFSAPIPFRNGVSRLDTLRVAVNTVNSDNFSSTRFEYLGVRDLLPISATFEEPYSFIGLKEPMACPLQGTPVARYYLDDAPDATSLADSSGGTPAADLAITTQSVLGGAASQPAVTDILGLGGLLWTTQRTGGYASLPLSGVGVGERVRVAMNGVEAATMELVIEPSAASSSGRIGIMGINQGGSVDDERFTVVLEPGANGSEWGRISAYAGNVRRGIWVIDFSASRRTVIHVVFNDPASPDWSLFRDGVLQAPVASISNGVDTLTVNNSSSVLWLGTPPGRNESMEGLLYYGAIYPAALSATEIARNARVLEANDDSP